MQEENKSIFKHRFTDAPWYKMLHGKNILLLGAGGIGSWVALCLARIGCNITLFDHDTVENHNLGGQLYGVTQVGSNKAEALSKLALDMSGGEAVFSCHGMYGPESYSNKIVISAFDNMEARKLAFAKWCELLSEDENKDDYLFIDGRLLAEEYQVYAVTRDRLEKYSATLFSDSEIGEVSCSLKSTTHCSMGIASDIISVLTNFMANKKYGVDAREVPFSIIKSISLFTYDIDLENDRSTREANEKEVFPAETVSDSTK